MSLLQIYRGDAKSLSLNFTNDDGTPFNVSGYSVWFAAAQSYVDEPLIYIGATGNNAAAVTGLITMNLTSGQTDQCPGDYLAEFRCIDPSGSPSTFNTEGLRILPTILP